MSRPIVIGGGVGGLAAAIQLARAGRPPLVLERAARFGGKLRQVVSGAATFDAGPSVLTMRWVFEELFDGKLADVIPLHAVDPLCRHFFPDGSVLDLYLDEERSADAITRFASAKDAAGYRAFRKHAAQIFATVRGPFLEEPLPDLWNFLTPKNLLAAARIDGMRNLWKALGSFFSDPRLVQLFGRYATYNGSSPFHAPATLAVIAHVENAFGIWACPDGLYRLAEALVARATSLGAELRASTEVVRITTDRRGKQPRVTGVELADGTTIPSELVIANADAAHVYGPLLNGEPAAQKALTRYEGEERSLSAFVLLGQSARPPLELAHHNVFFSRDYRREFRSLIDERRPPDEPTVYVCCEDRVQGPPRGDTERMFLLSNAPPQASPRPIDWAAEAPRAEQRIVKILDQFGWPLRLTDPHRITPAEMAERFPGSRGALYGLSSNSMMAAFRRPPNRMEEIEGLYLCGGSVHPGAGLPMVALSARTAVRLALGGSGK